MRVMGGGVIGDSRYFAGTDDNTGLLSREADSNPAIGQAMMNNEKITMNGIWLPSTHDI